MAARSQAELKGSVRLGNYLRKLRTGYGYSLRRVEEQARAEGGEIDNSQLSRYEKGICYPSFDKLRVLASVFNVPVQAFSDVVDLEEFEPLKPEDGDPDALAETGVTALRAGENGRAFALFERALELLLDTGIAAADARAGRLRVNLASALMRLGKVSLAERELRHALRHPEVLAPELRTRALLSLANIHADQGDCFLAEIEAERAYRMAREASERRLAAMAVHTLARVLSEQREFPRAVERFREAAALYAEAGERYEAVSVRINIGTAYVDLGKFREGLRILRECLGEARAGGYRRLEARVWHSLGQAHLGAREPLRARKCFRESSALASSATERHPDIEFLNAYYEWKMALEDDNPTGARIYFGRMKSLRSSIERRFPEVEAFDEFVERGQAHA